MKNRRVQSMLAAAALLLAVWPVALHGENAAPTPVQPGAAAPPGRGRGGRGNPISNVPAYGGLGQGFRPVPNEIKPVLTRVIQIDAISSDAVNRETNRAIDELRIAGFEITVDNARGNSFSSTGMLRASYQINLYVTPEVKEILASQGQAILEQHVARLKAIVAAEHLEAVKQFDNRIGDLDSRKRQANNALASAQDRATTLRKKIGEADLSPEAILPAIKEMQEKKRQLEIDLNMKAVRSQAIQETIAKIEVRAKELAGEDEIAKQMMIIVRAREAELNRVKELGKQNLISQADVAKAETALAEAQIQLLQRREAARQMSGGDLLGKLNADLLAITIDVREYEGRVKALAQQLAKATQMIEPGQQFEAISKEVSLAKNRYDQALQDLERVRIGNEQPVEPSVRMIDPNLAPVKTP